MKKDTYYFSHDANARNDIKILKIRRQIGAEAYAAYFMIIEVLREQVNFKLPMDSIPDLAYEFNISEEKVRAVIMNYGLFEIEQDEIFFSSRLLRSMDEYNLIKTALSEAGKKGNFIRWRSGGDQVAIAPQSQLNEIKLNESKVNESKVNSVLQKENADKPPNTNFIPPELIDIKNFISSNIQDAGAQNEAEKFYDHFKSNGWKVGGRAAMKDWKAALRNWIRNSKKFNTNGKSKSASSQQAASDFLEMAREEYQSITRGEQDH